MFFSLQLGFLVPFVFGARVLETLIGGWRPQLFR